MLANGIKSADVMPVMKELGDISMGDAEKLGSLSLAFAQISGKGKLAGQELLQLINAGFNPLQVISEKTGESMESLQKRMEKGQIGIDDVRSAMQLATGPGGKFENMLNKVANTPYGQLEGLKGQLEQMMVKIGEVFLPIASKFMTFIAWLSDKMGPLLQPVAVIMGGLAIGLLAVAAAQWVVNLAFLANPITWIIAGVVALIGVIIYLISKISGWGEAWKIVVNNAKLNWEVFTSGSELLWDGMINSFMIGLNKIKEGWYKFKNAVGIGDESENNEALTDIAANTQKRIDEIAKSKKDFDAKSLALDKGRKNPLDVMSWNKDSKISDVTDKLKATLGLNNLNKPGGILGEKTKKDTAKNGLKTKSKTASDGIVSGGSKQTHIVININKLNEKIEIITNNLKEGASEVEDKMNEVLLRVLNSSNQLQSP